MSLSVNSKHLVVNAATCCKLLKIMTNLVSKVEHFGKVRSYDAIEIACRYALLQGAFPDQKVTYFFYFDGIFTTRRFAAHGIRCHKVFCICLHCAMLALLDCGMILK